jgi:SAM-dependent methyltransferase
MSGGEQTTRALSFGQVAEQYDAARPGYPDALFDDLVAMLPGHRVAEIGAGTGKATGGLLARGLDVTAVEPDPAMAEVLLRRYGGQDRLTVVVTPFEGWNPEGRFDGLVSAQAWHWTDPAGRYERAARALRPGGLLALFWNVDALGTEPLHRQLLAIYHAHGIEADRPFATVEQQTADPLGTWPGDELSAHPLFDGVQHRRYRNERTYTGDELVTFLDTTSHHRIMADEVRQEVGAQIRAIVAAAPGGHVTVTRSTGMYTARRTATPTDAADH